jgi:hypothetical protein
MPHWNGSRASTSRNRYREWWRMSTRCTAFTAGDDGAPGQVSSVHSRYSSTGFRNDRGGGDDVPARKIIIQTSSPGTLDLDAGNPPPSTVAMRPVQLSRPGPSPEARERGIVPVTPKINTWSLHSSGL